MKQEIIKENVDNKEIEKNEELIENDDNKEIEKNEELIENDEGNEVVKDTKEDESNKENVDEKDIEESKASKKIIINKKVILASVFGVIIVAIICFVFVVVMNNKGKASFNISNTNSKNKKVEKKITYEEYKKDATEFYYERMLVKMGKDYEPCITMGEEKIFEKKKTKQRVVFYIKENKDSKSMGRAYLRKSVKKHNKKAVYIETVKYKEFEYDIYEGKNKDGKHIKYAIAANDESKILLIYTYEKKGQDSDLKLILESIRF